MKKTIVNGIILGLATGLIVTFFDSLLMLLPGIFVPSDYPFYLFGFNIVFWSLLGCISGIILRLYFRMWKHSENNACYSWFYVFLLPFSIAYGFLGKLDNSKFFSPSFDNHLSFLWVACVLVFLYCALKKKPDCKTSPVDFIPEIATIVALYMFCSNIIKVPGLTKFCLYLQNSGLTAVAQYVHMAVYILGILLIGLLYLLVFYKVVPFRRIGRVQVILILAVVISASTTLFYKTSRALCMKRNVVGAAALHEQQAKKTPHVFLIILDTVRADHMGMYSPRKTTKNLDAFSRDAVVFEKCIASSSWTFPSHASLFTGLYPVEHGSHYYQKNKTKGDGALATPRKLQEEFNTLAEIFTAHGYQTAGITANFVIVNKRNNFHQGFQLFDDSKGVGSLHAVPFKPLLNTFAYPVNTPHKYHLLYRAAEDINSNIFQALDRFSREPFFMFVNYMDAHFPYDPPRAYNKMFSDHRFPQLYKLRKSFFAEQTEQEQKDYSRFLQTQYLGSIAYLDHHLGILFSELKKKGLYDSSLIIVTSDHGELFGEHGLQGHECSLYEGVIRVPLLIKYPYSEKKGREAAPIAFSDLYSLVLDACALPVPGEIASKRLSDEISPVAAEYYNAQTGAQRVLYDGSYKLMAFEKNRKAEFYDVENDPRESNDLADVVPEKTQAASALLDEWLDTHKPHYNSREETVILTEEERADLRALGYIH